MAEVVLITGSETLLGRKLVEKELARGNRVIAPIGNKTGSSSENTREDFLTLPWNKSSVFSAKTVIREGERQLGPINRAVFLSPGNTESAYLMEMTISDIDDLLDNQIRGFIYLVREVYTLMKEREFSKLGFAMTHNKSSLCIQKGCIGFFKDFADKLIQEPTPAIEMCGFLSSSNDIDSYSHFIMEMLDTLPPKAKGQWLKHSDKKNLFSSLPIEKRN